MMCALTVAIGFLENLIPEMPFLPPGAKPGFSNIIIMFACEALSGAYVAAVVLTKVLFAFVTRGATAAIMSLSGGVISAFVMFLLLRKGKNKAGIAGVSVTGALCHNLGQLAAAAFISATLKIVYYLPALLVFAVLTGVVNGIIAGAVLPPLKRINNTFEQEE